MGVAVGYDHGCGLRVDGTVDCWGCWDEEFAGIGGPCDAPDERFVQIDGVEGEVCGVTVDGRVNCWGTASLDPLDGAGPFQQVSLSRSAGCGLFENGDVTCWKGSVPDTSGDFAKISVGSDTGCGITRDGELSCWGEHAERGPTTGRFVDVALDTWDACAVPEEGEVDCWGI